MSQNSFIKGNVVMNGESAQDLLADFSALHLQSIRRLHITVEVLDQHDKTIDVLHGVSTAGSVSIDGNSLIRRTGSLTFVLFDRLMPKQESLLWLTNKIRVYAGIDNLRDRNSTTTHFCLGTYFISEPSISLASDSRTISITLQDRMAMWESEQFENKVIIEPDTPVHVAIQMILSVVGERQFEYIEEIHGEDVPYQVEFAQGSTVLEALTTLTGFYMDNVAYYNTEGFFVYKKSLKSYDETLRPSWTYTEDSPLLISFGEQYTYKGVKNRVVVFGGMDEKTGIIPRSQMDLIPSSKFGADTIGIRKRVIVDQSYIKKSQCEAKAKFELWKASTFQEQASITGLPIYFLDAGDIIEVWNPATKSSERYEIVTISFGLGVGDLMSITAVKLYYGDVLVDIHEDSVQYLIEMISTKGWISIPEQRIKEYYGLEGDGSTLVVDFKYDQIGGNTAYVTGYMGTSTQTLTIDLVDLGNGTGDSGDNLLVSKGDYTDRIIGHEMLHAVMNNAFGLDKIATLPIWFREGSAELIHGADERLKDSIVVSGAISDEKLTKIIGLGTSILKDEGWSGASDDYSASYLIMKYLDHQITSGKDMKSLMLSIKNSEEEGRVALENAISENTAFDTFEAFIKSFEDNGEAYVRTYVTLNLDGDEVDTGSIAGTDHRGTRHLNAEDIFDNSTAIEGVISTGFKVEFETP